MSPEHEYKALAARFLLDMLSSSGGVKTTFADTVDGSRIGTDRSITSDYPQWYRDATSKPVSYDGDNIRAALEAVAEGRDPNMGQREARWIMERIEGAKAEGDATFGLPPAPRGGGTRGARQAFHGDAAVTRFPLRVPESVLAELKARAAKRRESVNVYVGRLLAAHVASRDTWDDEPPF